MPKYASLSNGRGTSAPQRHTLKTRGGNPG
jgi:hypothetical protein